MGKYYIKFIKILKSIISNMKGITNNIMNNLLQLV